LGLDDDPLPFDDEAVGDQFVDDAGHGRA
jgi:hypothetical protein